MKKILFAIALVLILTLSIVACNKDDNPSGDSEPVGTTEQNANDTGTDTEDEDTKSDESETDSEVETGTDPSDETEAGSDTETESDENTESEEESESEVESESESETESEEETKPFVEAPKVPTNRNNGPVPGEDKTIDIYLIAGQSNASGYTELSDFTGLNKYAPDLMLGYSNIFYAGDAMSTSVSGTVRTQKHADKDWMKLSFGLGRGSGYFGPEAGLAKALSVAYNSTTGNQAGIIKFASGGTCLRNVASGENQFGNWVSPSYAEHLGVTYDEGDITGALYRGLLAEVESNVAELIDLGYETVNLKGIYWMQGESDRGSEAEYEIAFTYFVNDLRADLSNIMKGLNGTDEDGGASEMAFFVGTISETFGSASRSNVAANRKFIEMQHGLVHLVDNCYVVDNSEYHINELDAATGTSVVVGTDMYHWNQKDALEIGYNVGRSIVRNCLADWSADDLNDSLTVDTDTDGWMNGQN